MTPLADALPLGVILSNPAQVHYFLQFLQRSSSSPSSEMSFLVLFLLEAQQFKLLGEHARARAFGNIYGKYLNPQGELLSHEMLRILSNEEQTALQAVHESLTSGTHPPKSTIFDPVMALVQDEIKRSVYPSFTWSEDYMEMKTKSQLLREKSFRNSDIEENLELPFQKLSDLVQSNLSRSIFLV